MRKITLHLILCIFLGWIAAAPLQARPPAQFPSTDEMWIDLSLQPELIDDFNQLARPDDIARIEHFSRLDFLEGLTAGKRLVIFKSVTDARELLPRIYDQFEVIGYNLEHGPSNDPSEQEDPVGSVILMRELADEYGKELALGPDHDFAVSDGVGMAPFVDRFILQVQRVQTEPDTVRSFVVPLAQQMRRVNPDLKISVQIRTEGDAEQLRALIDSLRGSIDGISILTSPETTDFAEELLRTLRPESAGALADALSATGSATPTPTVPTRTAVAPTPEALRLTAVSLSTATPTATPTTILTTVLTAVLRATQSPSSTTSEIAVLAQNDVAVTPTPSSTATANFEAIDTATPALDVAANPRSESEPEAPNSLPSQPDVAGQTWQTYALVAASCFGGGLLIAGVIYIFQHASD